MEKKTVYRVYTKYEIQEDLKHKTTKFAAWKAENLKDVFSFWNVYTMQTNLNQINTAAATDVALAWEESTCLSFIWSQVTEK